MSTQTLEQKRAKHALDQINALKNSGKSGKYVTYVKALPASILMNGLGQAFATECAASKNDQAHLELAKHVAKWLLHKDANTKYQPPAIVGEDTKLAQHLLGQIVDGNQDAYVWAQAEAMAYVTWLKKFAVAFLPEKP